MLFIISNSKDETTNYLCAKLQGRVPYLRFDTDFKYEDIELRLSREVDSLCLDGTTITHRDIKNVWFRRPKPLNLEIGEDAGENHHINLEWAAALENFFSSVAKERWMNHPAKNVAASNKIHQLNQACRLGFQVPRFLLTNIPQEAKAFLLSAKSDCVIKPLASGYIERNNGSDSLIYTNKVAAKHHETLELVRKCPVLLQYQVDKKCDVRITVVDHRITAVTLESTKNGIQELDIRRNNMEGVHYSIIELPTSVKTQVKNLLEYYNLRFAAIDMAIDHKGNWWFFEINPNGQWAWLDIVGVSSIWRSFVQSFNDEEQDAG